MAKSKKQVEGIVSGMGVFMAIITSLVELVKKFGGSMESLYRLATPEGNATLEKIARMIVGENKDVPTVGSFFMTVKLGQYPNIDALRDAIIRSGKKISKNADQILDKISISTIEQEIDLYELTGVDLGFVGLETHREFCKRAIELGFEMSSVEAIALARIQCDDGKWRIGGMMPIDVFGGALCVLGLSSYDGLHLDTHYRSSSCLCGPGSVWLFSRPRRK